MRSAVACTDGALHDHPFDYSWTRLGLPHELWPMNLSLILKSFSTHPLIQHLQPGSCHAARREDQDMQGSHAAVGYTYPSPPDQASTAQPGADEAQHTAKPAVEPHFEPWFSIPQHVQSAMPSTLRAHKVSRTDASCCVSIDA